MTRDLCTAAVIRAGELVPCERPASGLAFDPEGQGFDGDGFYPACRRHRARALPFVLAARPDLADLGLTSRIAGMAVSAS